MDSVGSARRVVLLSRGRQVPGSDQGNREIEATLYKDVSVRDIEQLRVALLRTKERGVFLRHCDGLLRGAHRAGKIVRVVVGQLDQE